MYDQPTSLESSSFLDSILGLARGGVDIYRGATAPVPVAPLPAAPRVGLAAPVPWYKQPLVLVGAVVLLLVGLFVVRRK